MGWLKVTIAWGIVYSVLLWAIFSVLSAMEIRLDRRRSIAGDPGPILPISFFGGLIAISWFGYHGRLPGIGMTTWPGFSFLLSLMAWSVGLGVVAGVTVGMSCYRTVSQAWARGEGASGLVIILPAGFAFVAGALVGAIIATVKAFL